MVPATDKHYTARITERRDFSEDLWLIRVDPGGPFQFKAGQYATLGVDHGDQRIERAYSIVSSPYEEALEFFIELCGHPSMCENGQGILQRAGWLKGSMFEEVYFVPGKETSE